jgi:hypothetical protein
MKQALALALLLPGRLAAQADSGAVLILQHDFVGGAPDSVAVTLRKTGYYRAELAGAAGTLLVRPSSGARWEALVVPVRMEDRAGIFEVHPGRSGTYWVQVAHLMEGRTATLRLYSDEPAARRIAVERERSWGIGLGLAAGFHTGYRLDPTGGLNPSGGGDVEGCILIETSSGLGGCLGIARQSLPDARVAVTWYFVEPRVRLLSRPLFGSSRTDLGLTLRIAQGSQIGSREISPTQVAGGIYLTQHLSPHGRSRGWSIYVAYHHGRLGNVPETEFRDTDRLAGGLTWVP